MLEFSEEYFNPEIKEGFFVDSTMKTVWAAMLETLARVSAVCEKYGLQWYCAYGTLLGAIRHEGFIPWDDDLDIWMKRKDYNKLMEVLPKELPQDYRILSPMTDDGYFLFHCCINNGRTITTNKERMLEYHGCPFTVAFDIFPLDVLPDNEEDRKRQLEAFSLVSDAAIVAKSMAESEIGEIEKKALVDGLVQLKKDMEARYGYSFDDEIFEQREPYKISSQFWKFANRIAMMFDEEESDYLVNYFDYKRFGSKFPREYFSEAYSADFENVMLPVPSGYDQLLKMIYGNYMVRIKGSGTHEYPFYARQLREAREIVKKLEKGKPKIDHILPLNWEQMTEGKKVILFEDGIPIYTEYGQKAIDKLKDVLELFKKNNDKCVLWWRPQSQIRIALKLMSSELLSAYDAIVAEYLNEGYGVYDTEVDDEVALARCDAYYGEKNSVVNLLEGKVPIMIEAIW